MMPPFGWRGGFLTWLSSSILRLRLSISMFCWLFLSCSSEMVCFCWLPCSCSSCRDERSEWSFSPSDDTCSCCSEKAKMGVKDDVPIYNIKYWVCTLHTLVQCAGRTLIKKILRGLCLWTHLLLPYLSSHSLQFLLCHGSLGHTQRFSFTQLLQEIDVIY